MAENDRSAPEHHTTNSIESNTPNGIMTTPPPNFAHELRIQIEDGSDHQHQQQRQEQPNQQPPTASSSIRTPTEFYSIRDATETMQQNISAIFNQACSELERRLNFNHVLQGVRRPRRRFSNPSTSPINRQHDSMGAIASVSGSIEEDEVLRIDLNSLHNPTTSGSASSSSNNGQGYVLSIHQENRADSTQHDEHLRAMSANRQLVNRSPSHSGANEPPDLTTAPPLPPPPPSLAARPRRSTGPGSAPTEPVDEFADVLAQVPEERRFLIALSRYVPFICILLTKSFYDHFDAVLNVAGLIGSFYFLNSSLQKQVARQVQWKRLIFVRDTLISFACLVHWLEKNKDYNNLLLVRKMTGSMSLTRLIYSLLLTDYTLKVITVFAKNLIAILPARTLHYNRRGSFYLLIEAISQVYRALAPIQPWLYFLVDSYEGAGRFFSGILLTAYAAMKFWFVFDMLRFLKKAISMFPRKVKYGSIPTKEDIEKTGDKCPICHDQYDSPVLLRCEHIFCENCIGSWFRSQVTCPMCRAKVVEDMTWLDGSTTEFIQLF